MIGKNTDGHLVSRQNVQFFISFSEVPNAHRGVLSSGGELLLIEKGDAKIIVLMAIELGDNASISVVH